MPAAQLEYEFGPFRVDPVHRMLWRGHDAVAIPPKPLALLLLLIEHRGKVLSKDQIIELLWEGAFGTEANLSVNIATLRKILGEKPRDHRYIVTLPQQGYSFVADVRVNAGAEAAPADPEPAGLVIRQLAVLPFRMIGFTAGTDYLGPGLSDAITSGLTSMRHVAVRATSSTQRATKALPGDVSIGRALGVDAVVEGTIRKVAGSLDVTAKLVRVVDSAILWQQSFSASAGALPQMGQQIADGIRTHLEGPDPDAMMKGLTENADAFRAYMQGRHHQTSLEPASFEKSVELFQQAISIDPTFALAHAAVARSYYSMWWEGANPEEPWADRIEAAARRALDLDPALADAYACLGLVELGGRYRFGAARALFERALSLAPMSSFAQHSCALYFVATADLDEALRRVRVALSLDPMCIEANFLVAFVYMHRREYRDAIRHLQAFSELDGRLTWSTYVLGWCYALNGDDAEAVEAFGRFDVVAGPPWMHAMLAFIHLHAKNSVESGKHLAEWRNMTVAQQGSFFWGAIVNVGLGDPEKAMDCLEKAYALQEPFLAFLSTDPRWETLRRTPRFQVLVGRVAGSHH
jgi:DNA-binding winged helix-turn-helix (wHTH) protein/tetratricopeptide (TPR) repeat protein